MIHKVAGTALALILSVVAAVPATAITQSPWTLGTAPAPTVEAGTLAAVSCATTTTCVAVGDNTAPDGYLRPYALVGNGKTWHIVAMPLPAGARGARPLSVSCTRVCITDAYAAVWVRVGITDALADGSLEPAALTRRAGLNG